jgi:hypothetical protein
MRPFVTTLLSRLLAQYTLNPEITRRIDLGFSEHDDARIAEIRGSENNRALRARRFGPLIKWLEGLQLIPSGFQV